MSDDYKRRTFEDKIKCLSILVKLLVIPEISVTTPKFKDRDIAYIMDKHDGQLYLS